MKSNQRKQNRLAQRLIVGACVAGLAGAAHADEEEHAFASDNGVYELGYTVAATEAMIGNYYSTPGGEAMTINRVEVALGFGQAGRPFEVLIYNDEDNDGNPVNSTLLSSTPGIVAEDGASFNVLKRQTIEVDPETVDGGFFVAVRLSDQPFDGFFTDGSWQTAPSVYRLNYQEPFNNWRVTGLPATGMFGGLTAIDVNDLTENFVQPVQLNWLIRAYATPAIESSAMVPDMNGDGTHDVFDVLIFLEAYNTTGADFNRDGVTNVFDLFDFLDAWAETPV